ncbi:MAG: FHA domain-containing protein, partial [Coprococcus sp.]|nr:FHA domain-containing protein [Coprococcus sp.]
RKKRNRNRNITRLPHGLGDDIEQNTGYPYTTSDKMTIQIDIIGRNPRTLTVDIDGSIFVGRASMCDVVINESSVSRQQLAIECLNGSLYIQPLDSTTNGTKLNGQLIYDKRQLFSGDKIIIGAVGLIVRW